MHHAIGEGHWQKIMEPTSEILVVRSYEGLEVPFQTKNSDITSLNYCVNLCPKCHFRHYQRWVQRWSLNSSLNYSLNSFLKWHFQAFIRSNSTTHFQISWYEHKGAGESSKVTITMDHKIGRMCMGSRETMNWCGTRIQNILWGQNCHIMS